MTIGAYLHARRKASGKKLGEIAAHMGIARSTIFWWEGPKSRAEPASIRKLLEFYGCNEIEIAEALRLRSLVPSATPSEGVAFEDAPTAV